MVAALHWEESGGIQGLPRLPFGTMSLLPILWVKVSHKPNSDSRLEK